MDERAVSLQRKAMTALSAVMIVSGGVMGTVASPHSASAQSTDALRRRIEIMEKQLKDMKAELEATKKKSEAAYKQAKEEDNADIKWHLGGYATADYTATSNTDDTNSFGGGTFNPIFLIGYRDLLLFEGELELETTTEGETDTKLEFANLSLMATDWLTVTAGKFLSPLGRFQQHSHPSWINKLPDRPAGFVEDGGTEHLSEVGVMLRGAAPAGSTTFEYAVFVGNGPRLASSAEDGVKLEGFGDDDNRDKAFGGRIGFRPWPYLNIGLSGMRSRLKGRQGTGGAVSSGDYDMEVADLEYVRGNLDIRGEFIRAHLDSLMTALDPASTTEAIAATTWHAWYVQAAYRLAGVTNNPILRNFEPVFRFSQFHVTGVDDFQTNEEDRWTVGLNYWFAPAIVAKAAYGSKDFHNKGDEDVLRVQLAFGL